MNDHISRPQTIHWDLEEIESALGEATQNGSPSDIAFFMAARADYFFRHSKIDDAEAEAARAFEIAASIQDDYVLGRVLGIQASILSLRGEPSAEEYFLRAINLLCQSKDQLYTALNNVHYGNLLSLQGRFTEALSHYEQAQELCKVVDSPDLQAVAMIGIGCAYHNAGRHLRAIEIWEQTATFARSHQRYDLEFTSIHNIAAAYVELDNATQAEFFAQQAYELSLKSKKADEAIYCHNLSASIHHLHKNYVRAMEEFLLSRYLYLEMGDVFNAAQAQTSIADCILALGRLDDGISALKAAEEELLPLEKNALIKTYEKLVEAYQLKGDYQTALTYYQKQVALEKEVFSIDLKTRLYTVERRLGEEKVQAETKLYQMRARQLKEKLTLQTMAQATQWEMLAKFRDELRHIIRTAYDPAQALKKIRERLKDLPGPEIDWMNFEKEFLSVHPEFQNKLKERYPELTRQELRLCQLLRTGLKSHEAAQLMSITERGVEQHRLRVRRKLGLKEKESLTEFLKNLD